MKTRFNTYDIVCGVKELQRFKGYRVNQIFDVDSKTYLIRLHGGENLKTTVLLESGTRFHTTAYEWPKNVAPSGFSMKLRKHLKNKRLEDVHQVGIDRIINFQFGSGIVAHHVILELYDRGNIILTDHEYNILNILRPHCENEEVRFAVHEKYPLNSAKQQSSIVTVEAVTTLIKSGVGKPLKSALMSILDCGPAVIEHFLIKHNLNTCMLGMSDKESGKIKKQSIRLFDVDKDLNQLMVAIQEANDFFLNADTSITIGYLLQKKTVNHNESTGAQEEYFQNVEFSPYCFSQYNGLEVKEFDTFLLAVDEYYSTIESQKIDMKTMQIEQNALKKLSNVKKDHTKRLEELLKAQEIDKLKAELITSNQVLVDKAILVVRSAIANQVSWSDIDILIKEAQQKDDPIANAIRQLKLEINHISLKLSDPYGLQEVENNSVNTKTVPLISTVVDIDLALSAFANARKFYDKKRSAAHKEKKTIDASQQALKSAERNTQRTLKDAQIICRISKARKVFWFEKFFWFISSENYLVIGGRDAQQNELIVKRYMRSSDVYVHAEVQGASSVVIRNNSTSEVTPKTLVEAGTMAISYSVAWDAKVVISAYWVYSHQVSKTAPTGEYLGTGSFMIRGKKNFLPSSSLVLGLSLLFKLDDTCVEKHRGERKVRNCNFDDFDENKSSEQEGESLLKSMLESEKAKTSVQVESNDSKKESLFPNTEVKIKHDFDMKHGNQYVLPNHQTSEASSEEVSIISPLPAQVTKKKTTNSKNTKIEQNIIKDNVSDITESCKSSVLKRGQKGKLKKMKIKYKNQDEEEKQLRMKILSSSGKDKISEPDSIEYPITSKPNKKLEVVDKDIPLASTLECSDELVFDADIEMLNTLTGQPLVDDELLFVIPIVAPYQALQNYKFKVKLIPGNGKRGHAARTALALFSKDKDCGGRERDLLKSIKDESLARNIPGKVKLSTQQIHKK